MNLPDLGHLKLLKRKRQEEIDNIDLDVELDMDAMWDNTVWEEITDIADAEGYEVENITATAGVRGAEAEDEALSLLYYRKSMRGLQKEDLERAYGKLMNKRSLIMKNNPNSLELKKIETYLLQIKQRINS